MFIQSKRYINHIIIEYTVYIKFLPRKCSLPGTGSKYMADEDIQRTSRFEELTNSPSSELLASSAGV